jgi:hypothetical protein
MADPATERKMSHTTDAGSLAGKTEVDRTSHDQDIKTTPSPPHGKGVVRDGDDEDARRRALNLKLANPLGEFSHAQLADMGEQYCRENALGEAEDIRAFRLGAQIAKDPLKFDGVEGLSEEERRILTEEVEHKWRQPRKLYLVVLLCSLCAAVQGMGKSRSPLRSLADSN